MTSLSAKATLLILNHVTKIFNCCSLQTIPTNATPWCYVALLPIL